MFKELVPILKDRAVTITLAREGELLRINVIPQKVGGKDDDDDDDIPGGKKSTSKTDEPEILTQPFTAVGSADELDAELPALLGHYVEIRSTMASAIEEMKRKAQEAIDAVTKETKKLESDADKKNKAAKDKLAAAKKKAGEKDPPPTPKTASLFGGDDDKPADPKPEDDGEGEDDAENEDGKGGDE